MKQSPYWDADSFSASQEIARILWNPKVQYRIHTCPPRVLVLRQTIQSIHKCPPRVLILRQSNTFHTQMPATCSYPETKQYNPYLRIPHLKVNFNIIFPSTSRSSKWPLFTDLSTNPVYTNPVYTRCYRLRPSQSKLEKTFSNLSIRRAKNTEVKPARINSVKFVIDFTQLSVTLIT
jgi:hypothetical protein